MINCVILKFQFVIFIILWTHARGVTLSCMYNKFLRLSGNSWFKENVKKIGKNKRERELYVCVSKAFKTKTYNSVHRERSMRQIHLPFDDILIQDYICQANLLFYLTFISRKNADILFYLCLLYRLASTFAAFSLPLKATAVYIIEAESRVLQPRAKFITKSLMYPEATFRT